MADADDEILTGVGEAIESPGDGPIYQPAEGEFQRTVRAVAIESRIWKKRSPSNAEALSFAVASGLIAGEGLMGVVTAALKLFGAEPLT